MTYTYTFMVMDDGGNIITERELTAEQAIDILVLPVPVEAPRAAIETASAGVEDEMPSTGRKKSACGNCGKSGHTKPTCPKTVAPTKKTGKKAKRGGEPKACCGSTGSRHFKTCRLSGSRDVGSSVDVEVSPKTEALSQDQYDAVRSAMHLREFSSAQYALTKRLSPREVNAAIRSGNYDDYLMSR